MLYRVPQIGRACKPSGFKCAHEREYRPAASKGAAIHFRKVTKTANRFANSLITVSQTRLGIRTLA